MSDQNLELYPQFSMRIDIPEIELKVASIRGVNVSKTKCKIMESFNIFENAQLKNAKQANRHFLENLNTQLKFELPK